MDELRLPRKVEDVVDRVKELEAARDETFPDMYRTAQILDGGLHAVQALTQGKDGGDIQFMPIANYLRDALEALASRMGAVPELRVDPPSRGRKTDQSDAAMKAAEKRARIVAAYDEMNRLPESLPQLARWVPGASYTVASVSRAKHAGLPYPKVTFHYPLDTALSQWTPQADPVDVGFVRRIPIREIVHRYPHAARQFDRRMEQGAIDLGERRDWKRGIKVVTYLDHHGTWVTIPDKGMVLDYVPNPLEDKPAFVAFVKFNYSRLRGEFDDLVGLMVSMARLNILAEIAVKDNVFAPTNIFGGHPLTGPYKKGRGVNIFDANTRVEIPQRGVQFEAWQQIDRLERQLNIEATMPQQERGESPMSFVTGRGLQSLGERVERKVGEYQTVFASGLRRLDAMQLEFDERSWPELTKPMSGTFRGSQYEETYTPKTHIKGAYRTSREYGVMAGVEEATKMNGLAIMDSGGWVSKRWVRSQISGLGNAQEIEEQIRTEGAEAVAMQLLAAHASQPESPEHMRALEAIVELLAPGEVKNVMGKWLTETQGPELSPEEQAMMGGPMGGVEEPPNPTAVLSRLTAGGEARGGVQTIGRL